MVKPLLSLFLGALPALAQDPLPHATAPARPLAAADCALVVVAADLASHGRCDLALVYELAECAGVVLPKALLANRYAEIVVLGGGDATLANFGAELARLTTRHAAVDAIVHCHGEPFELLWDDGRFDVYEAAERSRSPAAGRRGSGAQFALAAPGGTWWRAQPGGLQAGGGRIDRAARFRLLDLDGGTLADGDAVQIVTAQGGCWHVAGEPPALRLDGDPDDPATIFRIQLPDGDGGPLRLQAPNGGLVGRRDGGAIVTPAEPGGSTDWRVRWFEPRATPASLAPLRDAQRQRLRFCYSTACYGASHAAGWRHFGFKVVAGARGVHCDSATSFPVFLWTWRQGTPFAASVHAANRADPWRGSDALARRLGFRDVDSHRLVHGLGSLTHSSNPVP